MKNLILFIPFLIFSCHTKSNMKAHQKQVIVNYIQSYNDFDIEGMTKDLHKDIIFKNISNGEVNLKTEGIEAFIKQAETAKQYFKNRQQTIGSWDFQDEKITISINYKAILAVDLPNGMKTGDTLKLKGQSVFELRDGKIIKIQDQS